MLRPKPHPKLDSKPRLASHEVRIIGGLYKRSLLAVLGADGLRPTPNRVRETLFNWLGQDLSGLVCVDAFAGTGALGIEALSRGAQQVVFVEQNAQLAKAIAANLARLKITSGVLKTGDANHALAALAAHSVDLVFVDPPFQAELHLGAARAARHALKAGGALYIEAPSAQTFESIAALGFELARQSKAGAVHFALFIKTEAP